MKYVAQNVSRKLLPLTFTLNHLSLKQVTMPTPRHVAVAHRKSTYSDTKTTLSHTGLTF